MITEEALVKNKGLVTNYINAVGQKQYEELFKILDENFEFDGAINLHGAEGFIQMLKDHEKNPKTNIILRNDIKAIFIDGNESYVIYDIITNSKVGAVSCMEKIKIEKEKILSTDLKFDKFNMKRLRDEVTKTK